MKKINIKDRSIEELASDVTNIMGNEVSKVLDVLDLDLNDDIIKTIDGLSNNEDKDKLMGIIINEQLEKLKTTVTMKKFCKVSRDVDEVTDYYASKKEDFDAVIDEGDHIADDILFKVIGHNERRLELPIDISMIKDYSFSSNLKENQFYDTLTWIALRYIAISKCISSQKWSEDYNKSIA